MEKVLASVLKKITPTPREQKEIRSVIAEVEKALRVILKGMPYTFAGSFVRNTWMRDKKEFDVFLMFPKTTSREMLEKKGLLFGRQIMEYLGGTHHVAYAEHPYTRAVHNGFQIDIVPCYDLKNTSELKSAVDRTPFHNRYLEKRFHPKLSGEVRLLKQFLKASGLYGSDAKTCGFSGYLCELLILRYRTFSGLIRAAAAWQPGQVSIDVESHAKKSFSHPLVVIDPVDSERNVAAVLSPSQFARFTDRARMFKKKKSPQFFSLKKSPASLPRIREQMKKRGTCFLSIITAHQSILDDILYPQMRRTVSRIASLLEENDFRVMGTLVHADATKAILTIELDVWNLPAIRKIIGPPIHIAKRAEEFLRKYRSNRTWVEGSNWAAEIPRTFQSAEHLLKKIPRTEKRLREMGIAPALAASFSKKFQIQRLPRSQSYLQSLTIYLEQAYS